MKKRLKLLSLTLACSLLLNGCWDQRVFEQVGFTLSFAIEDSKDGDLLITSAYPLVGAMEKGTVDIISTDAHIVREGRGNFRYASPKFSEGGKVQQVLISDALAKKGVNNLLELFQRDVTTPAIAFVVVVEGSPSELLKKASEFKTKTRVSFYIYQLLENNVKLSNIPNTKVFDFDINYFAPGLDPIVPIIALRNETIHVTGSALFSGDKMAGKLDIQETNLLLAMMGQFKHTDFVFDAPELSEESIEKHGVAVTMFKQKRKVNIDFTEDGKPVVNIDLRLRCNIDEYVWDKTMDDNVQKELEGIFNEYLTRLSNKVIEKLQEANSDPIGIGDMIRAKYYDYWKSIDWDEMYKEAKISANIEIEIGNVGIIK